MTLLKQALAILGTVVTIAIIVAIVSPKTAQAVAAAFVQIEPGTTTHVGQNESQLVALACLPGVNGCFTVSPQGAYSTSVYVVPSGYTLIMTDWQFLSTTPVKPGNFGADYLVSLQNPTNPLTGGAVIVDSGGIIAAHEHFTVGIRCGSGTTIVDYNVSVYGNGGIAFIQGYLVPN